MELVCGIDVGTSAVRALVCDLQGTVRGAASRDLATPASAGALREQAPEEWWRATCAALRAATANLPAEAICAVAVDATSGTIVQVDRELKPIGPGILYNDGRAAGYAKQINEIAGEFIRRHGYRFKDEFSLAKMLWLRDHDPAFAQTWKILHQGDFINARLLGEVPATDWSTSLKSGCDLLAGGWAAFIGADLGFPMDKLPSRVVAPGAQLGHVCPTAAKATGLRAGTSLMAGASDGTAALFASGACRPGDFNTALGSTLVLKGITDSLIHDPDGVVYSHKHPSGYWLPGGAGNVGCVALNRRFAPDPRTRRRTLEALDRRLDAQLPCAVLTYPLGDLTEERFPFRKTGIAEFVQGRPSTPEEHYAAILQGIAFVERWCYEKLQGLGARIERIFSTGGGSRSRPWCSLRADVLGKAIHLPVEPETALGTAVLAAAHLCGSIEAASSRMVRLERSVAPGPRRFDDLYQQFREECRRRWGV